MGLNIDPNSYEYWGMTDYAEEFRKKTENLTSNYSTIPMVKSNVNVNEDGVDTISGWMRYTNRGCNPQDITLNYSSDKLQLTSPTVYTYKDGKKNQKAVDAAVDAVTEQFIKLGTANGKKVDEKEAKRLAQIFIKNEINKENFNSTRTFVDQEAYNKAEAERNTTKKGLVSQYMREDSTLSKKDAERRAESNLVRNQYLGNKSARNYIENHRSTFYDEAGNFSQEKYKAFAKTLMDVSTGDEEVDNYFLSLGERYNIAGKFGISDDGVCDVVHRAGGGFAKDYKEFKQAAMILIGAGAGYGIGTLMNTLSTAASGAAAGAGSSVTGAVSNATSNATAFATAEISGGEAIGATIGALAGEAANEYVPDVQKKNGDAVIAPAQPKPAEEDKKTEDKKTEGTKTEDKQDECQECELEPEEFHETVTEEVPYCSHTVKRGDDWFKVALTKYQVQIGTNEDGTPKTRAVTPAEASKIAHELKMAHGIERKDFGKCIFPKVGEELRLYNEFDGLYHKDLKGVKFIVNCDAETDGKSSNKPMKGQYQNWNGKYNGAQRENQIDGYWYTDCNGNRSEIFDTAAKRDAALQAAQKQH